tara:strand:+ start:1669 stop:2907 length:1239 start_codon:yes stop_codon:yes gene_type:complete
MTSPLDVGTVTAALKEHYKQLRVQNMVYKDNPLLAMMPKYTKFGGENMPIPLIYSNPQRRSATFATGKANTSTSAVERFVITRVKDYSFASITGESIKATERDSDAFLRYATMEVDGALNSLTRSLAISMYRDGTGTIGQQSATVDPGTTTTLTLSNGEDVTNFEVGMKVVLAETAIGALLGSVGTKEITAIDRDAGTLTTTTLHATADAGDFIIAEGDDYATGTKYKKVFGLEAWVPPVAPGSGVVPAALNGVTRTTDVTRLGGNRFDGSSLPIEEALIGAASRVAREGGSPDHCFVDYATFSNLEKALGSKVVYDEVKARDVDIGFAAISLRGPRGTIKIVPDQNCQPSVAWMLQLDTWCLNTLGEAPMFLDFDGNRMLRESGDDAYEVRMGYYGNVSCNAPGYNCRVAL